MSPASCAGTVAYMAPEVLQKGAMAMPADVYSFAMLMLELWTGCIVYSGINSHQVLTTSVWGPQKPMQQASRWRKLPRIAREDVLHDVLGQDLPRQFQ